MLNCFSIIFTGKLTNPPWNPRFGIIPHSKQLFRIIISVTVMGYQTRKSMDMLFKLESVCQRNHFRQGWLDRTADF